MSKKEKIIQVASTLFCEKGYEYTSVDEIAKECGISKGSFYKNFPSKEDLLIAIFEKMPGDLEKLLQKIHSSNYESHSQKLSDFITIALEYMLHDKVPFYFDTTTLYPALMKKNLQGKINSIVLEINLYLREFLQDLYGKQIKNYEGDLIFLLKGIIFQFIHSYRFLPNVDLQKGAAFIVSIFEIIVHGLIEKKPNPLISPDWDVIEILNKFNSPLNKGLRIQNILEKIEHEINSSSIITNQKEQYIKAVSLLADECTHPKPKEFLVNALITYLKTLPNTEIYCEELLIEISNNVN